MKDDTYDWSDDLLANDDQAEEFDWMEADEELDDGPLY